MLFANIFILLCGLFISVTNSAKILGIFPMPSFSHQVVFRALMLELGRRGHEVVIITPNPALEKNRPPDNITEIDTSEAYQLMAKMYLDSFTTQLKRGVVMDTEGLFTDQALYGIFELMTYPFDLDAVKELLNDRTRKFDLIIAEAIASYHLIVSHIYNAPVILFSSFYGFPEHYEAMGGVAWHPIYYPNFYRQKYRDLSYWEKLQEIYLEWRLFRNIQPYEDHENEMLKKRFGPDAPSVQDMKKNVQMLFLNSHPIFANNRPVPPNVVYLGGLHMQPVKPLPQELQEFLDNSTRGIIYVSLGTNVKPSLMHDDLLEAFLTAFEHLPYDILWKFDGDNLPRTPKNLRIEKWFPQRDLLTHSKIKLFITQGGLQSTDEAIDAAVPVVGVPMLGDQWFNVNKYVTLGIGEQVDVLTMTAADLVKAATKVIKNPKYRRNIRKLRDLINDQPQTPLDRAVWWTEHVLRHGGEHLRAPTINVTWAEYYMIDIVAIVLGTIFLTITLIVYLYRYLQRLYKRTFSPEDTTKKIKLHDLHKTE